jgi:tetratricopeptide (TPR) repeat protein
MTKKYAILALLWLALAAASSAADPNPRELLASGRVDEVTNLLNRRIQTAPNDAEALHLLARAYFAQQRWDQAISAAERAVALQPSNPEYHLWLGRAYGEKADKSNFVTAASLAKKLKLEFERAVQLDPSSVDARSDLAEFYIGAPGVLGGGKDKALAQAAEIAKHDPARAHWVRAAVAQKNGDLALAEKELKAAIEASHGHASYWLNLASFYRRNARLDEMEQAISKAVNAERKKPDALFDAAELLFRAGRNYPAALKFFRAYLASNTLSEEAPAFQAHYQLGLLLEKMGDRSAAAQEYRAALSLAKDFSRAQDALSKLNH